MIVGLYPNPDLFYPNLVYPKLWAFEHGFPMFFFYTPTAPAGHVDARDG